MRVSVILPFKGTRGDLPNLNLAIDSLAAQTRQPDEVFVVDDHNAPAVIDELKARVTPLAFTVIPNEGEGSGAARNTGLRAASGDWLLLQDADDLSVPTRIERLAEAAERDDAIGAWGSRCVYIGRAGQHVETPWTREYRAVTDWARQPHEIAALLPHRCCIIPPSMLLRRDLVTQVGGWDESLTFSGYDLLLRLLLETQLAKVGDELYAYRIHPNQSTRTDPETFARDMAAARGAFLMGG